VNFYRFTNPANEPRTVEDSIDRRDEMAERWHDQAVDRENERPMMLICCKWFHEERVIGEKPCDESMRGQKTHTICPECAVRFTMENGL